MPRLIDRRVFLAGAAASLTTAQERHVVYLVATAPMEAPKRMAADGVVFTRAYVACPDSGDWAPSLATGVFPHAMSQNAERRHAAGIFNGSWIEVASAADADRVLAELDGSAAGAGNVVVFTRRPAGNGWDEQCTHLPLALRFPKMIRGGAAYGFLMSSVDVTPTLASLFGVQLPYSAQGRDVSEILRTGGGIPPESIYSEGELRQPGEWRMVVRGLDKLVVTPDLKKPRLFNLGDDPDEQRDLAQERGHQLKIDELMALVRLWMRQTGDGMDASGLRRR